VLPETYLTFRRIDEPFCVIELGSLTCIATLARPAVAGAPVAGPVALLLRGVNELPPPPPEQPANRIAAVETASRRLSTSASFPSEETGLGVKGLGPDGGVWAPPPASTRRLLASRRAGRRYDPATFDVAVVVCTLAINGC